MTLRVLPSVGLECPGDTGPTDRIDARLTPQPMFGPAYGRPSCSGETSMTSIQGHAAMPLDREIAAYEKRQAELEANYFGKWVVFRDQQLIGAFDTLDAAASEAIRRFGRGPYLIRQVGAPPVVLPASVLYQPVNRVANR